MYRRLFTILVGCLLVAPQILAQNEQTTPKFGWLEVALSADRTTLQAVKAARKTVEKLPIELLPEDRLYKMLKEVDGRREVLSQAGKLIKQGKVKHLGLHLKEAVEAYQSAIDILEAGFVRYYDPGFLAEPVLQLGVALFQDGQIGFAQKAFQRALVLVPNLQLAEGYFGPRVRKLFDQVRKQQSFFQEEIPTPKEIGRIGAALSLHGILVVSIEPLGKKPVLRLALFETATDHYCAVETAMLDAGLAKLVGEELALRLKQAIVSVAGVSVVPQDDVEETNQPDGGIVLVQDDYDLPPVDPWYKKHWWIWPVAAAVVGAAVALPLTVFRRDVVDVRVSY
jgi:tetratricopeptide (TPR) repeat protein